MKFSIKFPVFYQMHKEMSVLVCKTDVLSTAKEKIKLVAIKMYNTVIFINAAYFLGFLCCPQFVGQ